MALAGLGSLSAAFWRSFSDSVHLRMLEEMRALVLRGGRMNCDALEFFPQVST